MAAIPFPPFRTFEYWLRARRINASLDDPWETLGAVARADSGEDVLIAAVAEAGAGLVTTLVDITG